MPLLSHISSISRESFVTRADLGQVLVHLTSVIQGSIYYLYFMWYLSETGNEICSLFSAATSREKRQIPSTTETGNDRICHLHDQLEIGLTYVLHYKQKLLAILFKNEHTFSALRLENTNLRKEMSAKEAELEKVKRLVHHNQSRLDLFEPNTTSQANVQSLSLLFCSKMVINLI